MRFQHWTLEKMILQELPEIGFHPLVNRRGETHFYTVNIFVWKNSFCCFFQNMFWHIIGAKLYLSRQTKCELHNPVIEERHSRFDARSHPDFIHAHKEQFRQSLLEFEIHHSPRI